MDNRQGATNHITHSDEYFTKFEKFLTAKYVRVGNNELLSAHGKGTINIEVMLNGIWHKHTINDVWYVPEMGRNLFSVAAITEKGYDFVASKNSCSISRNGEVLIVGKKVESQLYELKMKSIKPETMVEVNISAAVDTLQLWHERLGHQNKRHVQKFLKQ